MTAEQIIEFFGMKPLPDEGGFYVETYHSQEKIARSSLPKRYIGQRCFATAIIYLITPERFSKLHKLAGDEVFHFYLGGPVTMLQLHPDGYSEVVTLGRDIFNGQRVQVTVPRGSRPRLRLLREAVRFLPWYGC